MRRLLTIFVLALAVAVPAYSQATFDTSNDLFSATSPLSNNFTVGASGTLFAVDVLCENTTAAAFPTSFAATYNSVSMTQFGSTQNITGGGNNRYTFAVFQMTSPPTGASHPWSVTWTGGTGYSCYGLATSWNGTSTVTPIGNFVVNNGVSTLATVTLTNSAPGANNAAFSHSANPSGAGTVNQTAITNNSGGCCEAQSQRYDGTHGGLFTVSFASRDWATDVWEVCAPGGCSSAASTTRRNLRLLGIGGEHLIAWIEYHGPWLRPLLEAVRE